MFFSLRIFRFTLISPAMLVNNKNLDIVIILASDNLLLNLQTMMSGIEAGLVDITGFNRVRIQTYLMIQCFNDNYLPEVVPSSSSFCNETTGLVRKSLNRKMNYRFRNITVQFIFNKIDLKLTSRPQVPP